MNRQSDPPTPEGLPFLGNALRFSRDPIAAMESWIEMVDVVHIKASGQSIYMETAPELIEQILVDTEGRFTIGPAQRETFRGVEDHAVTTTTGERWKRLRRTLHPAFTKEAIDRYGDRMAATTAGYIDGWDDGDRINLNRQMRLLAVNILADSLLNIYVRGQEEIVISAVDALVDRANFSRPGQLLPD